MKRLFNLIPLVAVLLVSSGCSFASSPGGENCQRGICVVLKLSEPIRINEPVTVTMTVTTEQDEPELQLGFGLPPENLVSVEGQRQWTVDAKANQPVQVSTVIRFPSEGVWHIVGGALTREGKSVADSLNVEITSTGYVFNPTYDPNAIVTVVPLTSQSTQPTVEPPTYPENRSVGVKQTLNLAIPDDGSWLTHTIPVTTAPITATVDAIGASFFISHPRPQDLVIEVVAPDGKTVTRVWDHQAPTSDNDPNDASRQGQFLIKSYSKEFGGLPINGNWSVRIRDEVKGEAGVLSELLFSANWIEFLSSPRPTEPLPPGLQVEPTSANPMPTRPPSPVPSTTPSQGSQRAVPTSSASSIPGWNDILNDSFEFVWPSGSWSVAGAPTWDDTNYRSFTGQWSIWCARTNLNPATSNYANNMNAWAIYGPFDLSDATLAEFDFWYWNKSEAGYDYFDWLVSIDGTNFYNFPPVSGDSGGWRNVNVDLRNVPGLGNVIGRPSVWIAFNFVSDGSVTDQGAFVDDVKIRKFVPGQITAQGTFTYADRDNTNKPARFMKVFLYDDDPTGSDDLLATANTNTDGIFSFPPIRNWDVDDSNSSTTDGRLDLYVVWQAVYDDSATSTHQVTNTNGVLYKWNSYIGTNAVDGTIDFSSFIPFTQANVPAMWVFQDLRKGWEYVRNNTGGADSGDAAARWALNVNSLTPCPGSCFVPGIGPQGIFIADQDKVFPDVVIHELGHQYEYNARGIWWSGTECSPHDIWSQESVVCAWHEGLADFFPLAVNGDPIFTYGGGSINLETPNRNNPANAQGDDFEGRVAGALYDLFDSANDGFDQNVSFGFDEIWNIIKNAPAEDTMIDFWNHWQAAGYNKPLAAKALYQNTIDYPDTIPTPTPTPGPSPTPTSTPTPTPCAAIPNVPVLRQPPNSATVTAQPITLQWRNAACATHYRVRVRQDSTTGPLVVTVDGLTNSSYEVPMLAGGHTYHWRVRACNVSGCSSWSDYWSFTLP